MTNKVTEVVRLNPDIYKKLEAQLQKPLVTDQTSVLQAGYQLGIQAVLKLLREGYTIEG